MSAARVVWSKPRYVGQHARFDVQLVDEDGDGRTDVDSCVLTLVRASDPTGEPILDAVECTEDESAEPGTWFYLDPSLTVSGVVYGKPLRVIGQFTPTYDDGQTEPVTEIEGEIHTPL